MLRLLAVFGTQPEVIKMAPVIKELHKHPDKFICRICVTDGNASHRIVARLLKAATRNERNFTQS